MSDFYCPLYNQGLYIEKINQTHALVSMCCYQKSSPEQYHLIDFVNNDYLNKVRKTVLSGEKPSECNACWELEKLNYQSYRQGEILAQQTHRRQVYSSPVLINLLYNCENVCNLKCVICGPRYSSLWHADYKQLGYQPAQISASKHKTKNNALYLDLDFSKLESVHFQGGEPFLSNDHKHILKKAQQEGSINNLTVSYNTNGTVLPDQETIDLWKLAKLVKIYFSIDSVGKSFNYVRFPAQWEQVETNIIDGFFKITDLNIMFSVGPTVNITNVFYIGDIIKWVQENIAYNLQGDPTGIYVNPVGAISHGGKVLNLKNLTKDLQCKALTYLDKFKDCSAVLPIINSLSATSATTDNWIEYLNKLDQIRSTNWRQSLSQLSQHIV
jgi:uncharacterized radical SAM superfamily Fe-S cluster-containing enzyme